MATALAIIDMQAWMFRTPERASRLPLLIENVNRAIAEVGKRSWPIFEIRTEWPASRSAWSLRAQRANEAVLQIGSADVMPVDGLVVPVDCRRVIKTRHSAFIGTDFEAQLKDQGIGRLLIAGCWLDGCVTQTAIDAYERNIDAVIVADAVAAIDDTDAECGRRWARLLGDIPCLPLNEALKT